MECAYAPYNWTQTDDSNGAVPISNVPGAYANGYDVMMAKKICEANGWQLEIRKLDWESLVPAVQTGEIDCAIAGQSMTAERDELVDFAGPYIYASIVCLVQKDSALATATGISQLTGTCTSQRGTIWYETCLPQVKGATIQSAADDAGAMLMAVSSGTCDFVCTDMPTAQGAVISYPNLMILDFSNSSDNFQVSDEEINIGVSVRDGNKTLLDAMNAVLNPMSADDFNALMAQAVSIQPIEE
jgi:putative lysine transport system substrate-binding protein